MKQSKNELRQKAIDDQLKYGSWWPFTENAYVQNFEIIGRTIAFSIRGFPFLRIKLGAKSFEWYVLWAGFAWYWLCIFFMVGDREDFIPFNPFLYIDIPSTLLSGASYLFLMLGIYYKLGDWIQFSILRKDVDQYNRGKSWMLGYETKENDPFENEYFRQVFFEPILIGLVGISLILTELSMGLGVFFTTGAIFYGIDEYIYHNAKDIKFSKNRESIRKGKKNIKKHDEMDSKNPEDDMYDFS